MGILFLTESINWTNVISATAATISAIASAIAVFLVIKREKPSLKITLNKAMIDGIYFNLFYELRNNKIAILSAELLNISSYPLTIWKCELVLNGNRYVALCKEEEFDESLLPKQISSSNKLNVTTETLRCPITLQPFQFINSGFVFPKFMSPNKENMTLNVYFYCSHKKNPIIFKNINFISVNNINPQKNSSN